MLKMLADLIDADRYFMRKNYIKLSDLEIYKLARELSKISQKTYNDLDWQTKKIIADQFINGR